MKREWSHRYDALSVSMLVVGSLLYYGSYLTTGFNPYDEGSLIQISMRLLAGEIPYVDIDLGYGPLWYYPFVLVYRLFGVSLLATRLVLFLLAMSTVVLTYWVVRRSTGRWPIALWAATTVLLVPGTIHKLTIPFLIVTNLAVVAWLVSFAAPMTPLRAGVASLIGALTYLTRNDIGFVVLSIHVALILVLSLARPPAMRRRLCSLVVSVVALAVGISVPAISMAVVAERQGFSQQYATYLLLPNQYLMSVWRLVRGQQWVAVVGSSTGTDRSPPGSVGKDKDPEDAGRALSRPKWSSLADRPGARAFFVLTYASVVVPIPLVLYALVCWRAAVRSGRSLVEGLDTSDCIGTLAMTGVAYAAFPQFFFFRPDAAHLFQFLPGLTVVCFVVLGLAWSEPARRWDFRWRSAKVLAAVLILGFLATQVIYGLRSPASGSIAVARGRSELFVGANGIRSRVKPNEKRTFDWLVATIDSESSPGEWVLVFPYVPGINVFVDRPTYQRRLYVDDSILMLDPKWQQSMIARMTERPPKLIVVHDLKPNDQEISRFRNWALDVMSYVDTNYERIARRGGFELYLRTEGTG